MPAIDINTNFKFADLTEVGSPKQEYGLSKGLEEAAFNMAGGPDKINFYAQTQTDSDRQAMIDVLTIYKREKSRLDKINNTQEDIRALLKKQWREKQYGGDASTEFAKAVSSELLSSAATQEVTAKAGNIPPAPQIGLQPVSTQKAAEITTCCNDLTTKIEAISNKLNTLETLLQAKPGTETKSESVLNLEQLQQFKKELLESLTSVQSHVAPQSNAEITQLITDQIALLKETLLTKESLVAILNEFKQGLSKIETPVVPISTTNKIQQILKKSEIIALIKRIVADRIAAQKSNQRGLFQGKFQNQKPLSRQKKISEFFQAGGKKHKKHINKVVKLYIKGGFIQHLAGLAAASSAGPAGIAAYALKHGAPHLKNIAMNKFNQKFGNNQLVQGIVNNPLVQQQIQSRLPPNIKEALYSPQSQQMQQQPQQMQQQPQRSIPFRPRSIINPQSYGPTPSPYGPPPSPYGPPPSPYGPPPSPYGPPPSPYGFFPRFYQPYGMYGGDDSSDESNDNNLTNYGGGLSYAFDGVKGNMCLVEEDEITGYPYSAVTESTINEWYRSNPGQEPPQCTIHNYNQSERVNYQNQQAFSQNQDVAPSYSPNVPVQQIPSGQTQLLLPGQSQLVPSMNQPNVITPEILPPQIASQPVGNLQSPVIDTTATNLGESVANSPNMDQAVDNVSNRLNTSQKEKQTLMQYIKDALKDPKIKASFGTLLTTIKTGMTGAGVAAQGVIGSASAWLATNGLQLLFISIAAACLGATLWNLDRIVKLIVDILTGITNIIGKVIEFIKETIGNGMNNIGDALNGAKKLLTNSFAEVAQENVRPEEVDKNKKNLFQRAFTTGNVIKGSLLVLGLGAAKVAFSALTEGNYQKAEEKDDEELQKILQKENLNEDERKIVKRAIDYLITDIESKEIDEVLTQSKNAAEAYNKTLTKVENELTPEKIQSEITAALNEPSSQTGGNLLNKFNEWNTVISKESDKSKQQLFVESFDDDPNYSLKNMEIGAVDRVIFVVGTFFIRAIVLFMIEWGINSHMITTFQQCFKTYVVGYIAIFLVWVLIANAGENAYEENVLLSTLFYYINTNAHKSSKFRIALHIFVQIALLPILFIVKYKSSPIEQDSFEQRRAIYNAISQFTFFIWLMTSIIASRF